MRLGRLWVGVGDGAKKILSLAYSYLYGYAKKILSLVVNKSKLRLQQASFLNLSFVYSLAYRIFARDYIVERYEKVFSCMLGCTGPRGLYS